MELLRLIAARDQMAAALYQLGLQINRCIEVLNLSSDKRTRLAQAYRDIEAPINAIDELLAAWRSTER